MDIVAYVIVTLTVLMVLLLGAQKQGWVRKLLDWCPEILFANVTPPLLPIESQGPRYEED